MRILTALFAILAWNSIVFSQATLYQTDFENGHDFVFSGDLDTNKWIVASCAGNGPTISGDSSLYISKKGTIPGCGASGFDQYAFAESPSGTLAIIASTTIDGTCASSYVANFDYQVNHSTGDYYAELVYSIDGGASWVPVGVLTNTVGWTNQSMALPALLDGTSFDIGFRYVYNTVVITGDPIAVDNFKITGTDVTNPSISCNAPMTMSLESGCNYTITEPKDYFSTVTDNCTASDDITVITDPVEGTVLSSFHNDVITIEVIATDEAGNSSSCFVDVTLIDDIDPVVTTCPTDTTLYLDNSCTALLLDYSSEIVAADNCSSILTYTQSPAAGTPYSGESTETITIDIEDEQGNLSQCIFTLSVVDSILPTITCPLDQNGIANASCRMTLPNYTGLVTFSDNCVPNGAMTLTQSPAPGFLANDGELITMTLTGGDPSTPQTCSFTLNLADTTRPSITCPSISTQYVNNDCEFTLADYTGGIAWSDNCNSMLSSMTLTQSPNSGTVVSTTTPVTITIEDPSGNSRSCIATVTVLDTISPQITCPSDQSLDVNASCFATHPDYSGLVTVSDNCSAVGDLTISQSPVIGNTFNTTTLVTIQVVDEAGNSGVCTFNAIPIDNIDPSISCPTDFSVNSNASCQYVLTDMSGMVTASDNCSSAGNLVFTQTPTIGSTIGMGVTNISIEVEDENNNINQCSFNLEVIDGTNPTISCPGIQTEYVDENCESTVGDYISMASVSDNCTSIGNLTITQSPIPTSIFSSLETITLTVIDEAGNSSFCDFNIVGIDTTRPEIVCPVDFDVAIDGNCDYLIPDLIGDVLGSDNCSVFADMTVTQNPVGGSTGNGTTVIIFTLTDEQGNQQTCPTVASPIDDVAPTITCPSPINVNNGFDCDFTLPYYGTMAPVVDNCDNYIITQSPLQGSILNPGINMITLTVTDAGGNTSECEFPLTIQEFEAPTITCPGNTSTCNPVVNYLDPTISDNCFAYLVQTDATGFSSGDTFPIGTTVLEYTVYDSTGNSNNCSFFIEVLEYPSAAVILEDTITACGADAVLLEAEANTSGNGIWEVLSGDGLLGNEFANVTGLNNLNIGTTIVSWSVTTASCGYTSDTVVVINSSEPSAANVQDTVLACGLDQVLLTTATPSSGTGLWTSPQGALIDNPSNSVTFATEVPNGWNQFIWTISSPGCESKADTMMVLYSGNVAISTPDTSFCLDEFQSMTLEGSPISSEQSAQWYFTNGFGIFSDPFATSTDISSLQPGLNRIVYSVDHPNCPTDTDTVSVLIKLCDGFNPVFPTVITPNYDGKNDVFEIQYLQFLYPECEVLIFNRWGSVVYESIGYENPWDGFYNGEELPMGTYFYKISLNDEENTVYNGPISIIH